MSNLNRPSDKDDQQQPNELPSSSGNNSKSVTPKDVSAQDASARDVTERKVCSDDPDEKEQEMLDDAVELTFPASDPIAIPSPDKEQRDRQRRAERR
ncbi:MAG TPA: hypothetical protein VGE12_22955 [Noviherbaspirillum sp.]